MMMKSNLQRKLKFPMMMIGMMSVRIGKRNGQKKEMKQSSSIGKKSNRKKKRRVFLKYKRIKKIKKEEK